ncbi:metallophosphoesterase [Domibacillus indicus]|uniref:metallophosphoesterase n=1 Tax=Domibacillus indicus TaxID=1437523 RepID=UPI00203DB871|nr:metallophosphoesterase [Domibacillus indicus]MCM3787144.1 metallophosphoesterase [Domibacillus indicus]
MKRRNSKRLILLFLFLVLLGLFFYIQNNVLTVTALQVQSEKIPAAFSGYRIVQLSDLHSKSFGEHQQVLAEKVKREKPDIIVYTGDLIDLRRGGEAAGYDLMKKMVNIAPVYFVTGNHEEGDFAAKKDRLQKMGVHVLQNESMVIQRGGEAINLVGIDDPTRIETSEAIQQAKQSIKQRDQYTVLLSHRPELFSFYAGARMDLIFTGHAHGGQVRLPFVGGLFAPGQGFFPSYTAGAHMLGSSTMVVNRGLGNSLAPQRIFNRPEIVVVTLKQAK